jgi:hypothetical protein
MVQSILERDRQAGQLLSELERRQDDVLRGLDELDAKLTEVLRGLGVSFTDAPSESTTEHPESSSGRDNNLPSATPSSPRDDRVRE